MWWRTPVIPALGRLRQEDQCEFETNLGYKSELKASMNCIVRPGIPALGRLRQEDPCGFETSLGYKTDLRNCKAISKKQK